MAWNTVLSVMPIAARMKWLLMMRSATTPMAVRSLAPSASNRLSSTSGISRNATVPTAMMATASFTATRIASYTRSRRRAP